MAFKSVYLLFGILALAAAESYIGEDQYGSEYLLIPIPLSRQRRQTTVDVKENQVTLGHQGTIFENDEHLVSGSALVSKFSPSGPTTLGGGVSYEHNNRKTTVDVMKNPVGTQVTLGHQGNIFENDKHLVSGSALVSKQFRPKGPTTLGVGLGYEHKPSGSGINLNAANTRGYGTDVQATGNANLWKNGNSRLDAYANYGRHYGGPSGTGRPNYGGGLQYSHRF